LVGRGDFKVDANSSPVQGVSLAKRTGRRLHFRRGAWGQTAACPSTYGWSGAIQIKPPGRYRIDPQRRKIPPWKSPCARPRALRC